MIADFYQKELNQLREKAREFSRRFPALAPHLGGASTDPDVERILEGVAYLSAGIQERLDSEFPQFAQGLLQLIAPHYLRETPATTIIEFSPKEILNGNISIQAGTYIDSVESDNVSCRFATCFPVKAAPLRIASVNSESTGGKSGVISINFEVLKGSVQELNLDHLRLLVAGDYIDASHLYYLLNRFCCRIECEAEGRSVTLDKRYFKSIGMGDDHAMLDHPSNAMPTYRLLLEYFILKQKFFYMDIEKFQEWRPKILGNRFTINLYLDNLPDHMPKVDNNSFKLFTTPAINLFEHDAEPVQLDHKNAEVQVKPARSKNDDYSVHSVCSVEGHSRRSASKSRYLEVSLISKSQGEDPVFEINKRHGDDRQTHDTYLSISFPPGAKLPERETLSIRLKCSNGNKPDKLKAGDINKPTKNTSELVTFSNILPPTAYIPAQTGGAMLWSVLSHLALNYLPMADMKNLKSLLELYVPVTAGNTREETANRKRIDSIQDIRVVASERLVRGSLVRGQKIVMDVDGQGFAGMGDLYLFGEVLDRVFSDFVTLNSFTELRIHEVNTGEDLKWPARLGNRLLN